VDTEETDSGATSGLLIFDKPAGVTSRDCVNQVVRLLRVRYPKPKAVPKVGHAGTLDPLATGVLVMGIGAGVRLVPYIQQMTKHYDATFRLGWWSESGDLESPLHAYEPGEVPTFESLREAAKSLEGDIVQTPPATSAVKVGGKKAYKYAHRGQAVEVPSRVVRVDAMQLMRYEFPEIDVSIRCGSGTYVRTLGMDLAKACQTRAVMTRLVRTRIGVFSLSDACPANDLTLETLDGHLLPLAMGVAHLPTLSVSEHQIRLLGYGQKLGVDELPAVVHGAGQDSEHGKQQSEDAANVIEARVLDEAGVLRAIVHRQGAMWCPYRVFHRHDN
jgi:tRNA pseudouridine55 synthase